MDSTGEAFEPVLLDLSDRRDHLVLTRALGQFAVMMDETAQLEEESTLGRPAHLHRDHVASLWDYADRACTLLEIIERQLEANGAIRESIASSGE